jgi:hypothetical protein
MNKIVQIKIFNDLLDQFFDFLESNFQDFKSDIVLTRSTAEFVRKSNPRLVVEQFMSYVGPYKYEIFNCNELFFLDFEKNLYNITSDNVLSGMKLKNMWISSEITELQKANIWMYFQKLLKAGEKIIM